MVCRSEAGAGMDLNETGQFVLKLVLLVIAHLHLQEQERFVLQTELHGESTDEPDR